jgi:hypothetical protein
VHPGRILSFILQEGEREAVQRAIEIFSNRGFNVSAYIYDGFQVTSKDKAAIEEVLALVNKDQPLQFIMKPFKPALSGLEFSVVARDDDQTQAGWEQYATVNAEGFDTAINGHLTTKRDGDDTLVAGNDAEAALIFLDKCGDRFVKTDPAGEYCYVLNENRWEQGTHSLLRMIMELNILKSAGDKLAPYSSNVKNARNIQTAIIAYASCDPEFVFRNNAAIKDFLFYRNCVYSFNDNRFLSYEDTDLRPFIVIDKDIEREILPLDDPKMLMLKERVLCCFQSEEEIQYYMRILSRGITGHVEDKVFYPVIGGRDSGKGTLQECVKTAFGGYICHCHITSCKNNEFR